MLPNALAKQATLPLMTRLALGLAVPAWGAETDYTEEFMQQVEEVYDHFLPDPLGKRQPAPAEGAFAPRSTVGLNDGMNMPRG